MPPDTAPPRLSRPPTTAIDRKSSENFGTKEGPDATWKCVIERLPPTPARNPATAKAISLYIVTGVARLAAANLLPLTSNHARSVFDRLRVDAPGRGARATG